MRLLSLFIQSLLVIVFDFKVIISSSCNFSWKLLSVILVGPVVTRQVQDPLAVTCLEKRLYNHGHQTGVQKLSHIRSYGILKFDAPDSVLGLSANRLFIKRFFNEAAKK